LTHSASLSPSALRLRLEEINPELVEGLNIGILRLPLDFARDPEFVEGFRISNFGFRI
jgi:hypothetical protein